MHLYMRTGHLVKIDTIDILSLCLLYVGTNYKNLHYSVLDLVSCRLHYYGGNRYQVSNLQST